MIQIDLEHDTIAKGCLILSDVHQLGYLSHPGPVFLKRYVRLSKYDSLVDEVELIEAKPSYAHIQHKNDSQSTVSLRDLAPITDSNNDTLQEHLD